jgi:hypothetical protein
MSFLFLVTAAWKFRAQRFEQKLVFLVCGLFTAVFLSYLHHFLHFAFQFATNILVPAVMLALVAWGESLSELVGTNRGRVLVGGLLLINSLTSIAVTGQAVLQVKRGDFRWDANLIEAYSWINSHSSPGDLVFADYDNSNRIPQYSRNNVFCGYVNAVNFAEKFNAMSLFFNPGTPDSFRQGLVYRNAIRFVLLTMAEEQNLHLADSPFAAEVFRNSSAVILAVRAENNFSYSQPVRAHSSAAARQE